MMLLLIKEVRKACVCMYISVYIQYCLPSAICMMDKGATVYSRVAIFLPVITCEKFTTIYHECFTKEKFRG